MTTVKLFADLWNFQLRWSDQMNPKDPSAQPVRLASRTLPDVLLVEFPTIAGTAERSHYEGKHIFASVDPQPKSRDEDLICYLLWQSHQTGYQVKICDRIPKKDDCLHSAKQIDRMMMEKDEILILYPRSMRKSSTIPMISLLLPSNDTDHTPAIGAIDDWLSKQIVHVGFKTGGSEVRTAAWSHILLDGDLADRLVEEQGARKATLGTSIEYRY